LANRVELITDSGPKRWIAHEFRFALAAARIA
jgi:hypothetical protein